MVAKEPKLGKGACPPPTFHHIYTWSNDPALDMTPLTRIDLDGIIPARVYAMRCQKLVESGQNRPAHISQQCPDFAPASSTIATLATATCSIMFAIMGRNGRRVVDSREHFFLCAQIDIEFKNHFFPNHHHRKPLSKFKPFPCSGDPLTISPQYFTMMTCIHHMSSFTPNTR